MADEPVLTELSVEDKQRLEEAEQNLQAIKAGQLAKTKAAEAEAARAKSEEQAKQKREQMASSLVSMVEESIARKQEEDRIEAEAAIPKPTPIQPITMTKPKEPMFSLVVAVVVLTLTIIGETALTHMGLDIGMFNSVEVWLVSLMAGVVIPYVLHRCEEAFHWLGKVYTALGALAGIASISAFVFVRALNSMAAAQIAMNQPILGDLQQHITYVSVIGFSALAIVAAVAGEQCIGAIIKWCRGSQEPLELAQSETINMNGEIEE